jgi:hypothetical protein
MKIYFVGDFISNGPEDCTTDLFYRLLYHGRQQEKSCRLVDPMLCDDDTPLRLNRIGTFVPPLISPTVNWVVSGLVPDVLEGFPFGFEPVQFRKLIDYPYFPRAISVTNKR